VGIHNPNAIAQMAIAPDANCGFHVGAVEPCPHDPTIRYRMVLTLRGRRCEQHLQRCAIHAAIRGALESVPPTSLAIHDTGRSALITISGDLLGLTMAKIWLR